MTTYQHDLATRPVWMDPATYKDDVPWEEFDRLRREDPVPVFRQRHQTMYSVTRHADVVHVSRNPHLFSSHKNTSYMLLDTNQDVDELVATQGSIMVNMDAPGHAQIRGLVSAGFQPRMIRRLIEHLTEEGRKIIDRALERCEVDFVEDVAAELPLIATCEFLGVPVEDRKRIYGLTNRLLASEDPELRISPEDQMQAAIDMYMFAQEIATDRRAHTRDDIASTLLAAEVDGKKLTDMEYNTFFMQLAVAGGETTRNALTHGVHALLDHPDQLAVLRDEPSKLDRAIEEILRWASPVMAMRRQTTQDTVVAGVEIPENSGVLVWYPSANRDDRVFEDPYRFDIERRPNNHVAFGGGGSPHFCLGANLARTELKIMLTELLTRCEWEPLGEPDRLQSTFIRGIKRYPMRLTPRR